MTVTDDDLLLKSGKGDRQAFNVLVERHHRAIIQFIHRFLATADRATAEDLAQQVFLSAWTYAPTFRPQARIRTWLFRIATNACLNYRRSERVRVRFDRSDHIRPVRLIEVNDDGGSGAASGERGRQLRAAIAGLPPNQRAAIVLRYFHELSYAEIAEILGTSTSAVDSLLHRARRSLYENAGLKGERGSPQVSRE